MQDDDGSLPVPAGDAEHAPRGDAAGGDRHPRCGHIEDRLPRAALRRAGTLPRGRAWIDGRAILVPGDRGGHHPLARRALWRDRRDARNRTRDPHRGAGGAEDGECAGRSRHRLPFGRAAAQLWPCRRDRDPGRTGQRTGRGPRAGRLRRARLWPRPRGAARAAGELRAGPPLRPCRSARAERAAARLRHAPADGRDRGAAEPALLHQAVRSGAGGAGLLGLCRGYRQPRGGRAGAWRRLHRHGRRRDGPVDLHQEAHDLRRCGADGRRSRHLGHRQGSAGADGHGRADQDLLWRGDGHRHGRPRDDRDRRRQRRLGAGPPQGQPRRTDRHHAPARRGDPRGGARPAGCGRLRQPSQPADRADRRRQPDPRP